LQEFRHTFYCETYFPLNFGLYYYGFYKGENDHFVEYD
jgi:hypothetical protein